MRPTTLVAGLALCSASLARADIIADYQFTYVPNQSGFSATVASGLAASGTLVGNYNPDTNPTGTRTKPGLFGPFGATENLPVAVNELGAGFNGNLNTDTAGSFGLAFDTGAGTVTLRDWSANFLSNGPANLPLTLSLSTQSFRTRNPTFLYPGIPIELPLGEAQLTTFSLTQAGPSIGTISQTSATTYDFTVATLVNLSVSASLLGQTIDLPAQAPLPFAFAGTLTLTPQGATVSSLTPIAIDQSQQPGQTVPQFALPLPTLDPDAPANVLLDLTLNDIGVNVTGNLTTLATGILVPAPGCVALALIGAPMLARRRRNRS